jgi:NTP pyrophosphatase (non-canonical NTP hydrolase)
MEYSLRSVGDMDLDDYVELVPQIYWRHDDNRPVWDVWCHTLHHGAGVAERIRKNLPEDKLFPEIADFALWLFTAVHKLRGEFGVPKAGETERENLIRIQSSCSDLLWHKYPRICPLCFARKLKNQDTIENNFEPCDCALPQPDPRKKDEKRQDIRALRIFSERNREHKPQSINRWQELFASIFALNLGRSSLNDIALHFMEELGEASDALVRMYSYLEKDFSTPEPYWRQLRLEEQLADVFSWLFSLVERINLQKTRQGRCPQENKTWLSRIIWERYGCDQLHSFYCPTCKKAQCACPILLVPPSRSIEQLKQLHVASYASVEEQR